MAVFELSCSLTLSLSLALSGFFSHLLDAVQSTQHISFCPLSFYHLHCVVLCGWPTSLALGVHVCLVCSLRINVDLVSAKSKTIFYMALQSEHAQATQAHTPHTPSTVLLGFAFAFDFTLRSTPLQHNSNAHIHMDTYTSL